ncbi:hypothetical protein AAULR_12210 [Lacticaseibacillus rhamnosus MTCC 5462]|nr:hypothetical protein AAULR_12210 [Lacticaseibacillus rhamnosus MTCC 5462]EHJ24165.1 hypothetical protein R0011_03010 [Lacticaseibacillus rhamnosus R0011]GMB71722.1 hypothetical protein NCCP2648_09760 [Lacticaseibacillus rhamnosus]
MKTFFKIIIAISIIVDILVIVKAGFGSTATLGTMTVTLAILFIANFYDRRG